MKKDKMLIGDNIKKVKEKMPMVFYLTVFIFAVSCITAIILFCCYVLLLNAGFMTEITLMWLVLVLFIGSAIISTSLVRGLGNRIIFGSLRKITSASKAVANGDFSQRLEPPREKEIAELCDSFNEMVNKLGANELLARDFVSNVSAANTEEQIIALLLLKQENRDLALKNPEMITEDDFVTEFNRRVFNAMMRLHRSDGGLRTELLGMEFSPDEMGRIEKNEVARRQLSHNGPEVFRSAVAVLQDARRRKNLQEGSLDDRLAYLRAKQAKIHKGKADK